jgi:NADH-quinone oxidoreductase subunit C
MTNSTSNWIEAVKRDLGVEVLDSPADLQYFIDVEHQNVHQTLTYLRHIGFTQLSLLTCIDWIEKNEFQLVFILMNWDNGVHMLVRSILDRDEPEFTTITDIYPGAVYYEREVHEFFGVHFRGNPTYQKPLFLERWDDMPPLKKDFDPQAYSDSKFPKREHPHVFKSKFVEVTE